MGRAGVVAERCDLGAQTDQVRRLVFMVAIKRRSRETAREDEGVKDIRREAIGVIDNLLLDVAA
jgi:hypothetical protein